MKCKLCDEDKKLVKAHIIPRSLYKPLLEGGQPLSVLSTSPTSRPKKSRIGIYDNEIVCQDCEKIFSPWDDYAQKVLLAEPKEEDFLIDMGQKLAFKMVADYVKLKLFFISLLWRASKSKVDFFKRINIRPSEEQLKKMILLGNPGNFDNFAVILAKFDDPLGTIFQSPFRQRFNGINFCQFYLAGYVAYIKTDKRPSPEVFREFILTPKRPLIVILRNLRHSKEFPLMKKVAKMWAPKIK